MQAVCPDLVSDPGVADQYLTLGMERIIHTQQEELEVFVVQASLKEEYLERQHVCYPHSLRAPLKLNEGEKSYDCIGWAEMIS